METKISVEKIKINLFDINLDSSYYYWSDKNDLLKLDNCSYLPCIPYDTIDYKYIDLIGKNILIFFKNPKIFYGVSTINSILINGIKEKNYLYFSDSESDSGSDLDLNNNNQNSLVLIDSKLYQNLLTNYHLVNIPGLFFIKIDKIYIFNYEFNLNSFNKYFNESKKFIEFKYPSKVKQKNIVKSYYSDSKNLKSHIIKYLENLEINLNNNNSKELININEIKSDKNNKEPKQNINKDKIKFNIPILWNGCDKFKNVFFEHFKNNSFDKSIKKIFIEHWCNCLECEIIDNNDSLNCITNEKFKNKKKILKLIELEKDHIVFEDIINCYNNLDNFNQTETNVVDFKLDIEKINIVSCYQIDNPYKNCIFIINK